MAKSVEQQAFELIDKASRLIDDATLLDPKAQAALELNLSEAKDILDSVIEAAEDPDDHDEIDPDEVPDDE